MNAIIERLNSAGSSFIDFSAVMFVQASILILILLAADFLLRKRVRAVFRYCIWLLVLVKLIIPTSISSPVSIGNLFDDKLSEIKINQTETPSQIEQAGTVVKVPRLAITEPKPELYKEIDPAGTHLRSLEWQKEQAKVIETSAAEVDEQLKPVAASVSITWQGTAFIAWAVVSLIFILLLIQRAMFVKGLVAQADEITGGLNGLVQSCGKLVGMKGKVKLKTSANATSPAVCGLLRPVILLPQNLAPNLTKERLKAVLVHELIHIKRGDLWINLFQALLQIAYFYNPFVWLANAIIRRAREQAVDETVQVALGKSAESYPQILVNVAKLAFERPALSLRLIGVVENKSALKNRITRMLSRPIPKSAKLGLAGLMAIIIIGVLLLPMAKANVPKSNIDYSSVNVTEGIGFKEIILGDPNCSVEFIKSRLGSPDKETPDKQTKGYWLGYRERYGLDFWFDKNGSLKEIRLNKGFKGKLTSGISLESTINDVFEKYGKPLSEQTVDDLTKHFENQILYKLKGEKNSKIFYNQNWLLFWFEDDRINQIVIYPESKRFIATLSSGVTVELVGTCQYTENGVNCYRPDGLPLGKGLKIAKWNQRPEAGDIGFMFKVDGPEDMSLWYHGIEGAERTEASCDVIDEKGQKLEGWEAVLTKLDDDQMTTTAKFGAAAGAWKTVAEHDGLSIKIVNGVSFTKASETEQGVQIFTTDTIGRNVTQRIVAIDNSGKLHPWKGHTGSVSNSQMRQSIGTFPSLKLEQIEKFQFQTRPYEWVEFKNVSVKPNFKTDVQIEGGKPQPKVRTESPEISEPVRLAQLPAEENDYELILTFDDDRLGGARWYDVTINVTPVGAGTTEKLSIHIKAYIDGISNLVFKDNGVYWHNLKWAVPGRHGGSNYPTYINDIEWIPDWPGEEDVPRGEHKSKILLNLPFSLPRKPLNVQIKAGNPAVQAQDADALKKSESERVDLQQLIDSARAGQMVTVPKGIYTEPIVINKPLRLKGEDANDCIIEVTADEPAIFVDTKGKGVVTIENLTIKWQLATSDKDIEYPIALVAKDSRAQIKNCNFVPLGNFQRSPFAVRAMGFTNLNIDNCRFEGFEYTIQFGEGTEGILQNSVIANSGHQGVTNYSGSTLRVKGNIITGSKFHAVRCTGGKLYVEDNLLINNENRGIYLGGKSASGTITNNVIMGNGTNISGFARSQVSITNNIIADSGYAGISMRDSCRLLIADNIFLKNGRGIILHEEAGKNSNRISKNTFWKNKVNFENIKQFVTPIEAEPGLVDPNNGDFSLKSGPVLEQNQGLKKPGIFKALWKKFKKLEIVEGDL